ncbi:hypothetical protein RIR_jg4631.t1 [Rhizophagus irregularis DAOM 181602=DAOM 197198]|nr:hypothetical protein RIR_jg4631.t1 [Rhizophagus irregularis DAOM 181602=DAOM 197198]
MRARVVRYLIRQILFFGRTAHARKSDLKEIKSQSSNRKSTQGELKEFDQFEINDHTSPEEVAKVGNKFGEDKNGSKRKVEKDKRKISRQIFHQKL